MAEGYHFGSGGKLGVVIVPKAGLGNAASNIYNALMDRASVLTITARDSSEFSERRIDLELVDWEQAVANAWGAIDDRCAAHSSLQVTWGQWG